MLNYQTPKVEVLWLDREDIVTASTITHTDLVWGTKRWNSFDGIWEDGE